MEICNALAAAWADPSAVMAAPELARATALALARSFSFAEPPLEPVLGGVSLRLGAGFAAPLRADAPEIAAPSNCDAAEDFGRISRFLHAFVGIFLCEETDRKADEASAKKNSFAYANGVDENRQLALGGCHPDFECRAGSTSKRRHSPATITFPTTLVARASGSRVRGRSP